MQNLFAYLFLAIAFASVGLVCVVFLSLRGSDPEERADILRALGDFSAAFVGALLIALVLYRGSRRLTRLGILEHPPDQGADEGGEGESESESAA
ncbi:hypothetical protein [Glycomyces tenuis]|uniref:hypothetical protein n=1 Tax=Glycomyces tenuis TaxID=58116 RepID=UPI00041876AC|nr:hypothetical protein [Glycomyces tenuis]